jgi:hypothetical protein
MGDTLNAHTVTPASAERFLFHLLDTVPSHR